MVKRKEAVVFSSPNPFTAFSEHIIFWICRYAYKCLFGKMLDRKKLDVLIVDELRVPNNYHIR